MEAVFDRSRIGRKAVVRLLSYNTLVEAFERLRETLMGIKRTEGDVCGGGLSECNWELPVNRTLER